MARDIGANRVLNPKDGHFHHPFGVPTLPPETEAEWRLEATKAALDTLTKAVDKPTVFEV